MEMMHESYGVNHKNEMLVKLLEKHAKGNVELDQRIAEQEVWIQICRWKMSKCQ